MKFREISLNGESYHILEEDEDNITICKLGQKTKTLVAKDSKRYLAIFYQDLEMVTSSPKVHDYEPKRGYDYEVECLDELKPHLNPHETIVKLSNLVEKGDEDLTEQIEKLLYLQLRSHLGLELYGEGEDIPLCYKQDILNLLKEINMSKKNPLDVFTDEVIKDLASMYGSELDRRGLRTEESDSSNEDDAKGDVEDMEEEVSFDELLDGVEWGSVLEAIKKAGFASRFSAKIKEYEATSEDATKYLQGLVKANKCTLEELLEVLKGLEKTSTEEEEEEEEEEVKEDEEEEVKEDEEEEEDVTIDSLDNESLLLVINKEGLDISKSLKKALKKDKDISKDKALKKELKNLKKELKEIYE
jgi:hypothetical protein